MKKLLILPLLPSTLLDGAAFAANCGHGACDSPAPEIGTGLIGIAAIVSGLIVAGAVKYLHARKRAI